jgi:hypothetical protein
MECVRALENGLHPVCFAGHRAFARQTPNDVFGHDGTQQVAVAIAESSYEALRNGPFSCSFILGSWDMLLSSVNEIGFL